MPSVTQNCGAADGTAIEAITLANARIQARRVAAARNLSPQRVAELIDAIASKGDLSNAQAGQALDAMINAVGEALKAGDSVTLVGFGTFSVKERAARSGRNPKTGETIQIAASKVPGFKAGKGLKDAVS